MQPAIVLISQAVHIEPLAASYHSNLGVAYQNLQRLEEAAACYERALALQPDHVDALNNHGVVQLRSGGWMAALQELRALPEAAPEQPDAEQHRIAAVTAGRQEEAEQRLRRALKLQPGYAEALITWPACCWCAGSRRRR